MEKVTLVFGKNGKHQSNTKHVYTLINNLYNWRQDITNFFFLQNDITVKNGSTK